MGGGEGGEAGRGLGDMKTSEGYELVKGAERMTRQKEKKERGEEDGEGGGR